jgi:hypothetical protein
LTETVAHGFSVLAKRLGRINLAARRARAQPKGHDRVQPEQAFRCYQHFSDVERDTQPNLYESQQVVLSDITPNLERTFGRGSNAVEAGKETVAGVIYANATMAVDRSTKHKVVVMKHLEGPLIPEALYVRGEADHIGDHDCHLPGLAHMGQTFVTQKSSR